MPVGTHHQQIGCVALGKRENGFARVTRREGTGRVGDVAHDPREFLRERGVARGLELGKEVDGDLERVPVERISIRRRG